MVTHQPSRRLLSSRGIDKGSAGCRINRLFYKPIYTWSVEAGSPAIPGIYPARNALTVETGVKNLNGIHIRNNFSFFISECRPQIHAGFPYQPGELFKNNHRAIRQGSRLCGIENFLSLFINSFCMQLVIDSFDGSAYIKSGSGITFQPGRLICFKCRTTAKSTGPVATQKGM